MPKYFSEGSERAALTDARVGELLDGVLSAWGRIERVLLVPPDFTRFHSGAGAVTAMLYERLKGRAHVEVMPAIGTHFDMTPSECERMFPGIPASAFRAHDWRNGLARLGEVPPEFVKEVSEGKLDYPIACEVNRALVDGGWDRVVSIGQVVPHEVAGMANHNKNILVGIGGQDTINKTHFLGSVYGVERLMGREKSPVRDVFNYMERHFLRDVPVSYIQLVRAKDETGQIVTRGIFAADDDSCFLEAAALSRKVNLDLLAQPLRKVVVYLDPAEFKTTWLGNKAIYRTRMALADNAELIVLAPGIREFGEDPQNDRMIRKYGYHGTSFVLDAVARNADLAASLGAASHLIVGSTEGRFRVFYCTGEMPRADVEAAGYAFGDLAAMLRRYDPAKLRDGVNVMDDGEEIFYISNPALGLWSAADRFAV